MVTERTAYWLKATGIAGGGNGIMGKIDSGPWEKFFQDMDFWDNLQWIADT